MYTPGRIKRRRIEVEVEFSPHIEQILIVKIERAVRVCRVRYKWNSRDSVAPTRVGFLVEGLSVYGCSRSRSHRVFRRPYQEKVVSSVRTDWPAWNSRRIL